MCEKCDEGFKLVKVQFGHCIQKQHRMFSYKIRWTLLTLLTCKCRCGVPSLLCRQTFSIHLLLFSPIFVVTLIMAIFTYTKDNLEALRCDYCSKVLVATFTVDSYIVFVTKCTAAFFTDLSVSLVAYARQECMVNH
jgi:hypothetical protein